MGKFEKNTICKYCGGELNAKNRNKKFCSDKCRVYYNRENPTEPKIILTDLTKPNKEIKPVDVKKPITNTVIDTSKPPIPIRQEGENAFDFAARKNEWKRQYGQ